MTLQVGALMGALVAAGVLELKPMLQHILTAAPADAAPEEPPAVVDSGDALKVLGALLNQITAKKGEAASLSAWESTSLTLEAFLPEVPPTTTTRTHRNECTRECAHANEIKLYNSMYNVPQ